MRHVGTRVSRHALGCLEPDQFIPGQKRVRTLPAFEEIGDPLTDLGTTAWAWAATSDAAKPVRYYAQPEDAPLYKAPPAPVAGATDNLGSVFLEFLEVPALMLAAANGTRAFPLAFTATSRRTRSRTRRKSKPQRSLRHAS